MSNVAVFGNANLPSVASLSTALRSISTDVGPSGSVIIKMDKTGHWVFGADQTEIEDGSLWAINPFSFVHYMNYLNAFIQKYMEALTRCGRGTS